MLFTLNETLSTLRKGQLWLQDDTQWLWDGAKWIKTLVNQDDIDDMGGGVRDDVAQELGYLDFEDMMSIAQAHGRTLIVGGYLNTQMIRIGPGASYVPAVEYTLEPYTDMTLQELIDLYGGD